MVSIILKLGNLIFIPTTNIDGTSGCEITNDYGAYGIIFTQMTNHSYMTNLTFVWIKYLIFELNL